MGEADTIRRPPKGAVGIWWVFQMAPILFMLMAMNAESMGMLAVASLLAVLSIVVSTWWKRRSRPSSEPVLYAGRITAVPPESNAGWRLFSGLLLGGLGLFCLFNPDWTWPTRVGMSLILLSLTFLSIMNRNRKLQPLLATLYGVSSLVAALLIGYDAVVHYQEGGEESLLTGTKYALFAGLMLFAGIMVIRDRQRANQFHTPLHAEGFDSQWGFMPWNITRTTIEETEEGGLLKATIFNGWSYHMAVRSEDLETARQLIQNSTNDEASIENISGIPRNATDATV